MASLIFILFVLTTFMASSHQSEETLQLVHVSGKQRAYQLGKLLRTKYDSFLGDIYTPELVEATSTDYDRTKMSALLVLAGLFPPAPSQTWNDNLSWLPIPYHFERNEYDYFIRRPTGYCPTYVTELKKITELPVYKKVLQDYEEVLKYIEQSIEKPTRSLDDVFAIYQTLDSEMQMNLTLPEWTKTVFPDPISFLAGQQCNFENYNDILKRLNGGRMLKKVIENMKNKTSDKLTPLGRKIYLYSGHENNVINILAALNVFLPHVPNYSAAAIIELHKLSETGEHVVKVLYAKDVEAEPEVQQIPGCESLCDLNKFIEITKSHVPVNYTAECNSDVFLN
ncbi:acid phosphatase-related [Holotrichia oblita]|uniref:Acid phosphatase-related n=1 Tax=Holotrichia oblita TaxID=644536 RepID=A0ACB9SY69_HOLOL|nr:acid phosphatase-related [Holotrichia oblita]